MPSIASQLAGERKKTRAKVEARRQGHAAMEPKTYSIRMLPDLHARAKAAAALEKVTFSDLVSRALEAYLED